MDPACLLDPLVRGLVPHWAVHYMSRRVPVVPVFHRLFPGCQFLERSLITMSRQFPSPVHMEFQFRCSSWKNPPLEKTPPFTGAQNLWLQISNSEGGAQKNGYYQDVP